MYKVLIVDDEPIIREGIEKTIPWEQLDCAVAGSAPDGLSALEKARELRPQIIISDIKMPKMDGLALLGAVREFLPDVQFIVISGYDDFKFAQSAINAQACAYLLKPLVPEELVSLLGEITEKLRAAEQQNRQLDAFHLQEAQLSKSRLLRKLIDHTFTDEDNYTFAQLIQQESSCYYTVVAVSLDDFAFLSNLLSMNEISLIVKNFKLIINELSDNKNTTVFAASHESICCILSDEAFPQLSKRLQATVDDIRKWLSQNVSHPATIGIGKTYRGILKVSNSYLEALKALGFKYLLNNTNVICFKDIAQAISLPHTTVALDETALIQHVEEGNLDAASRILQEVFSPNAMQTSRIDLLVIARSLLYRCTQLLQDYSLDINVIFPNFKEKVQNILLNPSIQEVYQSLNTIMRNVSAAIQNAQCNDINAAIQKAIKYVENNYADSSLSLNSVAKYISFNPSYFSSIFSKHVGKSFIDFVTELRIQKACDLLINTPTKISSIAQMVGYHSQTYFSTRFREITGTSPSQYRVEQK